MARTLVASDYNAGDKAHFSVSYEFCRVICECDDVDLVAPGLDNVVERRFGHLLPVHDHHNVQRDFNRMTNAARKCLGLRNGATIERTQVAGEYEMFVYIAWSVQSLVELDRLMHWRERSHIKVLYLFELWESSIPYDARYLHLLSQFDHVFLLHKAAIGPLERVTGVDLHWLPPGVDCMTATPPPASPRVIDFYSYGNRSAEVHQQLLRLSEWRGLFYLYDSLSSTDSRVKSWHDHRLLIANTIKRSRYVIAFNPASLDTDKRTKIRGEHVLASRLFEAAAGGAVILGAAPRCREFAELFPWTDAVIEINPDGRDVADVIDALERQPQRLDRLRSAGTIGCLFRHDWAYRWKAIIREAGLAPLPQLSRRITKLEELARHVRQPTTRRADDTANDDLHHVGSHCSVL